MEILITFFLGIFIIAGACVARCVRNTKIIEQLSISAAFGTMLALSIMELFPEAFEQLGKDNVWVIITFIALGVLLLKLLDHFIPKHHHSHGADRRYTAENVIHIGIISSIAVILHNVIEGMAVYSIAAESLSSGVMMAIAVGLHNIPMGMVIYSTLRQEKKTTRTALISGVALSTFAGGLIMASLWFIITPFVIGILMSLTLGMIIYILIFELAPHVMQSSSRALSAIGILAGIVVILAGGFLE